MKDPFPDIEQVLGLGLLLPEEQREQVAQRLLDSLKGPDRTIERAWKVEVIRRMESVERGESKLIPHGQVVRELDNNLRLWDRENAVAAALELPHDDRAAVIQRLIQSLPDNFEVSPT